MNKVTEIREALATAVEHLPGDTKVVMGPSDFSNRGMGDDVGDLSFMLRKVAGEPSPENEGVVDELVMQVAAVFGRQQDLPEPVGVARVTRCSGHRLYAAGPHEPPTLGCEWTIVVTGQ